MRRSKSAKDGGPRRAGDLLEQNCLSQRRKPGRARGKIGRSPASDELGEDRVGPGEVAGDLLRGRSRTGRHGLATRYTE
jgi:hypothetical protein